MTAIQGNLFKTIRKEPIKWGRWVESSLGTHLLNYCIKNTALLYYWRNGNDAIDFVLEKNGYVIGIEVKSGLARGSTGMKSFKKIFKPEKIYMIGKDGFSWQDFLSMEPSQLF